MSNYKDLERVVELLERSLDPDSRVEQDVQMPVLASIKGATAQCDVVVWSNQGENEVITIVEVQDRTTQMVPNDVRGFVGKRDEVGANKVVCVSRRDFSESVKERSAQSDGKLVLMVINDWDIGSVRSFV